MTTITGVDYKSTFPHPILSRIHGEPDLSSLIILKNELKGNSQSVLSRLGGGQFGHLGAVLTAAEYTAISDVPYVRPVHPGVQAIIGENATQYVISNLNTQHRESLRSFQQQHDVERTLINQIVAAVDKSYLSELRNRTTNTITSHVSAILTHLFADKDLIPGEYLKAFERVSATVYSALHSPIEDVFNLIEDLEDLSAHTPTPLTQSYKITLGTAILEKGGQFHLAIGEWNKQTEEYKTWAQFKTDFKAARVALKRQQPTIGDSTLNPQANAITETIQNAINEAILPAQRENEQLVAQLANATMQTDTLISRLQELEQAQAHSQPPPFTHPGFFPPGYAPPPPGMMYCPPAQNNFRQHSGRQQRQPSRQSRNQQTPRVRATNQYCWTHGGCAHPGRDCNTRAEGHQVTATFANKMNGSTNNCN